MFDRDFFDNIKNTRFRQYTSALIATLTLFASGQFVTWPSPAIPLLHSTNDSVVGKPITEVEDSWIGSCYLLFNVFYAAIVGVILKRFRRKTVILTAGLLFLVHAVMITSATSVPVIIASRCVGGVAMITSYIICIVYTGEIADEDIRGNLTTYMTLLKACGALSVFAIGPFVPYKALGAMCVATPLVFLCLYRFAVESPYYLVKVGEVREARANLAALSGGGDEKTVDVKLAVIQKTVEEDMKNAGSHFDLFRNDQYRKAIIIALAMKSMLQFSGSSTFEVYSQTIIANTNSWLSAQISSTIFGAIQIPSVFLAGILVDRVGRRPLLMSSALGCSVALSGLGTYYFVQSYLRWDTSSVDWLPTTSLIVYYVTLNVGMEPLACVLLGELFPTNVKEVATSTMAIYSTAAAFTVTKSYKPLQHAVGEYAAFYFFSTACLLSAAFVYFCLPETKGKKLYEIQEMLNKK